MSVSVSVRSLDWDSHCIVNRILGFAFAQALV